MAETMDLMTGDLWMHEQGAETLRAAGWREGWHGNGAAGCLARGLQ